METKKGLTLAEIEDDPSSPVILKCVIAYDGMCDMGRGQFMPYKYKVGDELPRSQILLKSGHWVIA